MYFGLNLKKHSVLLRLDSLKVIVERKRFIILRKIVTCEQCQPDTVPKTNMSQK